MTRPDGSEDAPKGNGDFQVFFRGWPRNRACLLSAANVESNAKIPVSRTQNDMKASFDGILGAVMGL